MGWGTAMQTQAFTSAKLLADVTRDAEAYDRVFAAFKLPKETDEEKAVRKEAIQRETEAAQVGRKARIIAKLNALLEERIIEALYEASCAGVQIDLIVRGVCALRPGIPGLSENIRVTSVVGRFLEHSRIYYFWADGKEKLWLASADWMERNFFRRVEVAFPLKDATLKRRVIEEGLLNYLQPDTAAWKMDSNGDYHVGGELLSPEHDAQQRLLRKLTAQGS